MSTDDPYDLDRFVAAQSEDYEIALRELKAGAKRSHWIWYVFPQVAGLGASATSDQYAIKSRREAEAYLKHPLLGRRLVECANSLLQVENKTAREVMGYPDDLKLRSSMTLFAALSPSASPFQAVLERYFSGLRDPRTIEYLSSHA